MQPDIMAIISLRASISLAASKSFFSISFELMNSSSEISLEVHDYDFLFTRCKQFFARCIFW